MISDPYKVLGVSPSTSDEELAKAYRRLAKKHHPDVNHGDPASAKRMSEINAAYEQIKSGNTSQSSSGYGGQSGYGSSYGTSGPGGSGPFDGGYNPFGGFGSYGNGGQQSRDASEFAQVESYIRAGYYQEALQLLAGFRVRGAKWYYYSAVANAGIGNKITALNHARAAVQLEPNNLEYQRVLNKLLYSGGEYQEQSQGYGMPTINFNKLCIGLCLAKLFCSFCGL